MPWIAPAGRLPVTLSQNRPPFTVRQSWSPAAASAASGLSGSAHIRVIATPADAGESFQSSDPTREASRRPSAVPAYMYAPAATAALMFRPVPEASDVSRESCARLPGDAVHPP